jgi:hypothetical protein
MRSKSKIKIKDIVSSREQSLDFWEISLIGQEYDSITEASDQLRVRREHIQMQLSGKVPHAKGLVFERLVV